MLSVIHFSLIVFLALLLIEIARVGYFGMQSRKLARQTTLAGNTEAPGPSTILILGDSVGCGTGASHPTLSIAGKLVGRFPQVNVSNKSTLGGVGLHKLNRQLKEEVGSYDIVILFVGGLDIIHFSEKQNYSKLLSDSYHHARRLGKHVIHVSPANVGLAPIFRPPLSWIYEKRSREFHEITQKIASVHNIIHVDMFYEKDCDPFQQKHEFYSEDLSHPSDIGYQLWSSRVIEKVEYLLYGN